MHDAVTALSAWESFYVIVGSSGGALIGLQFVVMTLIAERRQRTQTGALSAFGTPTVVHLTGVLAVSAIMSAPWPSVRQLAFLLGIVGAAGIAYSAVVIRRAKRQTDYAPVWEDWLWYTALPSVAYLGLTVAAFLLPGHPAGALFGTAAAALGLLLVGIHNAWDTVTHLVVSAE
jgi:hypothetical protein